MATAVLMLGLTYLAAAVPFGLVVTTLGGGDVDPRTAGSGNIGATNIGRLYGARVAAVVLVLDVLKGTVPVLLAPLIFPGVAFASLVGAAAFLGHCFSIYLSFHGGKGVATGAGVMFALAPAPTAAAVLAWIGLLGLTGRSSVASLGSAALLAVACWAWVPEVFVPAVVLLGAIGLTHQGNVRRLIAGEEAAVVRPVRWGRRRTTTAADLLNAPIARSTSIGEEEA